MGYVSIKSFSKNLKKYIEKAKKGENITIYDENKLFLLKQIKQKGKGFRPYGLSKGEVTISDDFNQQLPNEWLNEFY
jgi:antitoxin (DNA-binding transcriptional repressor) of toxin-antitoxin stability system